MIVRIQNEYYRHTNFNVFETEMPYLPKVGESIQIDDPQCLSNPNDDSGCPYFKVTDVTHYFDAEGKYGYTIVYVKGEDE